MGFWIELRDSTNLCGITRALKNQTSSSALMPPISGASYQVRDLVDSHKLLMVHKACFIGINVPTPFHPKR